MIHHLQQDVEDVRMRLFDLVQQQHAMRLLADGFGEQAALVETYIAGRCADQARHGMAFHVFGHVEAVYRHAHDVGKLACHFGLADAGGAGKQEAADRFLRVAEAAARHLDGAGQRIDGFVLTENRGFQVAVQILQCVAVIMRHGACRDAGDLGNDLLDLVLAHDLLLFGFGQDALGGSCFIQYINGLVRQVAVVDESVQTIRRRW